MKPGDLFKLHPVCFNIKPFEEMAVRLMPYKQALRVRFTGEFRIPKPGEWEIGGSYETDPDKVSPNSSAINVWRDSIYTRPCFIGELVEVQITETPLRVVDSSEFLDSID